MSRVAPAGAMNSAAARRAWRSIHGTRTPNDSAHGTVYDSAHDTAHFGVLSAFCQLGADFALTRLLRPPTLHLPTEEARLFFRPSSQRLLLTRLQYKC